MARDEASRELLQVGLDARLPGIAERWYQALITTGFPPRSPAAVRQ